MYSWDLKCNWSLRFFFCRSFCFYFSCPNIPSSATPLPPSGAAAHRGFLDHTQRHTTVRWNPLDELTALCRDLYLTTHDIHHTTGRHPCPRRDSKPQSQQASSCRPTPETDRPLGPVRAELRYFKFNSTTVNMQSVKWMQTIKSWRLTVNESIFVNCIISPFQILTIQIGYFTKTKSITTVEKFEEALYKICYHKKKQ